MSQDNQDRIKDFYARKFGLSSEQVRFFDELTAEQVEEVRQFFSAGLVGVGNYVYAVKRTGKLVWGRLKRDELVEQLGG